jgi:hypothetical protein
MLDWPLAMIAARAEFQRKAQLNWTTQPKQQAQPNLTVPVTAHRTPRKVPRKSMERQQSVPRPMP